MKQLYALVTTDDPAKQALYVKRAGDTLDFCTYFNSFSLKKWRQYTTLQTVTIKLEFRGTFEITLLTVDSRGEHIVAKERAEGGYTHTLPLAETKGDLLGLRLRSLSAGAAYQSGAYYGEASAWQGRKIGVGICTFKREEYVRRTMKTLADFQQTHDWLSVLVVDNGSTLPTQETTSLRIVHNRNYGGSGGFTRAMIEYVEQGSVDYVLLMDDDIVLEPSAIERTRSLLSCLKPEYQDSFLSGAMLSLEQPTLQYENTAYWGKIRLHGLGKGFHMDDLHDCVRNESLGTYPNQYGAWWYCCIPLHRIREIGYPLPVFLKGDDMEYGIRNHRPVLSMNGIAVWHQSFAKKQNDLVNYFSDRNSFILNHYAYGCNRWTLLVGILGRFYKRVKGNTKYPLQTFYLTLCDYEEGLYKLTNIAPDTQIKIIKCKMTEEKSIETIIRVCSFLLCIIFNYSSIDSKYNDFRKDNLFTNDFWKRYLRLEEK